MSKLELYDVWAEDIFEWFLVHVSFSGGDGAGAIICENFKETAQWFLDWYKEKYRIEFNMGRLVKDEDDTHINFHDENENWIFTSDLNKTLWRGDYIFMIKEDCRFMSDKVESDRVIKCLKSVI